MSPNNLLINLFLNTSWSKVISNHILRSSSPPPERRSGHIMVAHGNCLYIYGGVLVNNVYHDLYSFDLETNTWHLITMTTNTPVINFNLKKKISILNKYFFLIRHLMLVHLWLQVFSMVRCIYLVVLLIRIRVAMSYIDLK